MDSFRKEVIAELQQLKGSGKFASVKTADFIMPGLQVEPIGEISFPLKEKQAKALLNIASKAPFGLGTETVYDDKVRRVKELDPEAFSIDNPAWTQFIDKGVKQIKDDLGLEGHAISAHLFKLLIYETGDFFLPHKDTEKEKGMFGTMIVGLPSHYSGGELVISFEGEEVVSDFSNGKSKYGLNYTAFYADCDHEVKPLTEGYRICLVYNLVQAPKEKKIALLSMGKYKDNIARLIKQQTDTLKSRPFIFLLDHQYTPDNFASSALKLNDRYKAEVLLQVAKKIGCYAKLCLVTSYQMGIPEPDDYQYGYGEYGGDDDAAMGEVYEEGLSINHWDEKAPIPSLNNVSFEEKDLIASFLKEEYEPIIKESTGYMGNYGPNLEHWYHFGAVIVWSKEANASLLKTANIETQLAWMSYFLKQEEISKEEEDALTTILGFMGDNASQNSDTINCDIVADWLITHEDYQLMNELNKCTLKFYFLNISADKWIELFRFAGRESTIGILDKVTQDSSVVLFEKLLSVLKQMVTEERLRDAAAGQTEKLPGLLKDRYAETKESLSIKGISDLNSLASLPHSSGQWINEIIDAITARGDRNYVHQSLVPFILNQEKQSRLTKQLEQYCHDFLQARVDNTPEPPKDWSRDIPKERKKSEWDAFYDYSKEDKKVWNMLKDFLASPEQRIFEYKAKKDVREVVEATIKRSIVDLRTETVRKGSPHTLKITKTQDAHNRAFKRWREDKALLERLERKKR